MFRRRAVNNKSSRVARPPNANILNGSAGGATQHDGPHAATSVAGALLDYSLMLLLVFGGCCSYVATFLPSDWFWFLHAQVLIML